MKNLTFFFTPIIIESGVTAPGITPRLSNNLVGDPKDKFPSEFIIEAIIFKSTLVSSKKTSK